MWLIEMSDKSIDHLQRRAEVCAKEVASKGDVLMYGSKRAGAAGDVFNRLAEGMACLLLITKHPVPFERLVFYPDGRVVEYETEKDANNAVWPVQKKTEKTTFQQPVVHSVCERTDQISKDEHDIEPDSGGKELDRNDAEG